MPGRFDQPVRMYKAPPAHALTEEFYETDPKNDFARGFAIQTVGPLPVAFGKQMLAAKKAWGWGLRREMMDYNHWAAFGLLGEILPWADNRVTLSEDKDRFGLPVAHVTFNLHDNDKKLIKAAKEKTKQVMPPPVRPRSCRRRATLTWLEHAAWAQIPVPPSSTSSAARTTSPTSSSATAAFFPRRARPTRGSPFRRSLHALRTTWSRRATTSSVAANAT